MDGIRLIGGRETRTLQNGLNCYPDVKNAESSDPYKMRNAESSALCGPKDCSIDTTLLPVIMIITTV